MLLLLAPAKGQAGEIVEEPAYDEIEEASDPSAETPEEGYEEPAKYSWTNESEYYKEAVEARKIDNESWKKAIEGLDYSKTAKPKKKKEKPPTTPGDPPDPPIDFGDGSFFIWLFRGLLLLVGLAVIVLIVKNVIQMNPAPKNIAIQQDQSVEKLDLQHIEENLNTADLDPLIQRAIAQENFTMAVRLYYLAILKKLSEQKFVVWKKDKTNRDYLRELHLSALRQPFQEATRDFEWVWYGDGAVGKQDFERMQGQFQKMLSLIQQNNRP